ncbi:unnamed protein product [Eruca vesicaria subsp. sativa]|uniref:Uncharacterized protein n=1 Tax=Eruca vesicaria subsp. sativa TaxID=29727 RepID=A0ABC8JX84_ERUVS|nr:unnamed protein product [Eruca vesicaria subsp. sativa]
MTEGGTAVAVLAIAATSLVAVKMTGNVIYVPIGLLLETYLEWYVAILLIQRIRHALIGRAMDDQDMRKILHFLMNDSVVYALNDCKSEVIDPESFRFKAEIGGVSSTVSKDCAPSSFSCGFFFEVVYSKLSKHVVGEEVVTALGSEVIRLEKQIRELVPGI